MAEAGAALPDSTAAPTGRTNGGPIPHILRLFTLRRTRAPRTPHRHRRPSERRTAIRGRTAENGAFCHPLANRAFVGAICLWALSAGAMEQRLFDATGDGLTLAREEPAKVVGRAFAGTLVPQHRRVRLVGATLGFAVQLAHLVGRRHVRVERGPDAGTRVRVLPVLGRAVLARDAGAFFLGGRGGGETKRTMTRSSSSESSLSSSMPTTAWSCRSRPFRSAEMRRIRPFPSPFAKKGLH